MILLMTTLGIASSICNAMHIPHIVTHWTPEPLGGHNARNELTLNVYPDSNVLSRALADLLVDYSWKSFTVLYDTDEGRILALEYSVMSPFKYFLIPPLHTLSPSQETAINHLPSSRPFQP